MTHTRLITALAEPVRQSITRPAIARVQAGPRDAFLGFVRDEASAALLRESLGQHFPGGVQIQIADFRACIATLATIATPQTTLVDLSGEEQPINAMMELAEVVEPGTSVLAIGDIQNITFYRTVTRGMGIKEYLAKPLTAAAVERNLVPFITQAPAQEPRSRGGRLVALFGSRGGVGTSTVATNLAWLLGTECHRHTVLMDADLHGGTIALNLSLEGNSGLGVALASPERIDQLLIERAVQPAGDRLHVLAAEEALGKQIDYQLGSATALVKALRARFSFVVTDTGATLAPFTRDLLGLAQQRVIVLDPSMIAIRNCERLLTLAPGEDQAPEVITVLNRAGAPGGLSQSYMEQIMGRRFDAVIPDLPRIVPRSTHLGLPAASLRGPFRAAMSTLAQALGATVLAAAN